MCFNVVEKGIQAERDIECWKVMTVYSDGKVNSCNFPVKIGYFVGETILGTGAVNGHPRRHAQSLSHCKVLTSQVVHSFDSKRVAEKMLLWYHLYNLVDTKVVKCIIPKGTWYWYNEHDHEYASFALKVKEIISI